ncbi:MAG: TIGR02217 family protein, partial [Ruegeria sp.]|nr:TIGR02217 family protein [Ruegeria sp.]
SDYKSGPATADVSQGDQVIARGDGTRTAFQLVKTYSSGGFTYVRPIVKPVLGTVQIGLEQDQMREGVDFEIDLASGLVTFSAPPPEEVEVTAGFEFDVPVRFDTDKIQTSVASFQAGDVPNVPVVEVRV